MLTKIAIDNLKPRPSRYEVPDGNGLYVVVQPSGRKSWALRFRIGGKPRKLTFDRGLSLAEARAAAAKAMVEVEKDNDPTIAKRKRKEVQRVAAANTFRSVAEAYLRHEGRKKGNDRLRSLEWRRAQLERLIYPTLGDLPVAAIKRRAVIDLLDKIEYGELVNPKTGVLIRGGATMAHSTLAIVRKIMRWHAVRDEEYVAPIVPGMARIAPAKHARSRTLTDGELKAVWRTAELRGTDPFAAMVRFLLLTGARRGEAAALTWDEIDGSDWILPPARNKVKVELVRPLSKSAQVVLAGQPRIIDCPYVFTYGRRALSAFSQLKDNFDGTCGVVGWTLHDLRRTARTLMSRAGVNSDTAEQCLGHLLHGVKKTYNRDDFREQKKLAFDALAALIDRIVHSPDTNVAHLHSWRT
jgi:integrase